MKNSSKVIAVFVLSLLGMGTSVLLRAQSVNNPGYLGHTRTIGLGTQLSCGLYGGLKTQELLTLSAEQTVDRQHAVMVRATAGMLNVPFDRVSLSVDGPGAGSVASYYGTLDCGNPPPVYTRSLGVQIKRYMLSRGAIAPYGMYITAGGEWRTVSVSDSFNQLVFVEDNYNDPNVAYRFKLPNVMPRNTKGFNVLVGIGNKRFFNEQFFLDYQFGMTWLFWSNVDAYNNYYDVQAVGAAYNVQNSIELQMRRADTRRQLFTLNLTAGMVF
ncbi:MAG: hypothetical protein ORO02_02160 [Bacteroidia bacterium]|nr:hypothetical protein [Bacteroidia bacterium]